ncbi:MAG: hypothetical protein M3N82_08625, partial [Pseudomonadota bacterium]|nr:hypothetical protein [Pseudomonadota bacterium]
TPEAGRCERRRRLAPSQGPSTIGSQAASVQGGFTPPFSRRLACPTAWAFTGGIPDFVSRLSVAKNLR